MFRSRLRKRMTISNISLEQQNSILLNGDDQYFRTAVGPTSGPVDSKNLTILALVKPSPLQLAHVLELNYETTLDLQTFDNPIVMFRLMGNGTMRLECYDLMGEVFRGVSTAAISPVADEWNIVGVSINPASGLCKFIRWAESTGLDVQSVTPAVNTDTAAVLGQTANVTIDCNFNQPDAARRFFEGGQERVYFSRAYNDLANSTVQDNIIQSDAIQEWQDTLGAAVLYHKGNVSDFPANLGTYTNGSGNKIYDTITAFGNPTSSADIPEAPFTI